MDIELETEWSWKVEWYDWHALLWLQIFYCGGMYGVAFCGWTVTYGRRLKPFNHSYCTTAPGPPLTVEEINTAVDAMMAIPKPEPPGTILLGEWESMKNEPVGFRVRMK